MPASSATRSVADELGDAFRSTVAQPPTRVQRAHDLALDLVTRGFGAGVLLLLGGSMLEVLRQAGPAIQQHGIEFVVSSTWDSNRDQYGVLPQIVGPLYTSSLALVDGGTFGVAVAVVLSQGFLPRLVRFGFLSLFSPSLFTDPNRRQVDVQELHAGYDLG